MEQVRAKSTEVDANVSDAVSKCTNPVIYPSLLQETAQPPSRQLRLTANRQLLHRYLPHV